MDGDHCSRTLESALSFLEPPGTTRSTGSFIRGPSGLLFGATRGHGQISIIGIGGRPERGESLLMALEREGREEAGINLRPRDKDVTLFLVAGEVPDAVCLHRDMTPRPALVWAGPVEAKGKRMDYLCAVWECTYSGKPRPGEEVDLLLWAAPEAVLSGRWLHDAVEPVGGSLSGTERLVPHGSAATARTWLAYKGSENPDPVPGREILMRRGATDDLIIHSDLVALVSLAIGRRLQASGHDIDLEDLVTAGLCHDIGKAGVAPGTDISDHAAVSAVLARSEGLSPRIQTAIHQHMLPRIVDPGLGDDWTERVLFYADKVVGMEYMGITSRLDDLKARRPNIAPGVEICRQPLADLERAIARAAGLTVSQLQRVCYVASLGQWP